MSNDEDNSWFGLTEEQLNINFIKDKKTITRIKELQECLQTTLKKDIDNLHKYKVQAKLLFHSAGRINDKKPKNIESKELYNLLYDEYRGILNMFNNVLSNLNSHPYTYSGDHPFSIDGIGLSLILRTIIEESAQLHFMLYKKEKRKTTKYNFSNFKETSDAIKIVKEKVIKQQKVDKNPKNSEIWYTSLISECTLPPKDNKITLNYLIKENLPYKFMGSYKILCNNAHASKMNYYLEDIESLLLMLKNDIYPLMCEFINIYIYYFLTEPCNNNPELSDIYKSIYLSKTKHYLNL